MSLIYDIYNDEAKLNKQRKIINNQKKIIAELLSLCRESDQWWLMVEARKTINKYGYKE